MLGQHRRDLEAATSDAATLRSRLDDVESRHTELAAAAREQDELRVKFENELAAARGELQQKAWASAQQQAAWKTWRSPTRAKSKSSKAKLARSGIESASAITKLNDPSRKLTCSINALQN